LTAGAEKGTEGTKKATRKKSERRTTQKGKQRGVWINKQKRNRRPWTHLKPGGIVKELEAVERK